MKARKPVMTYEALAADVVSNGIGRRASLVIMATGKQQVLVRISPDILVRLGCRIGMVLTPRRVFPASRR
jgi:hypothetical protein